MTFSRCAAAQIFGAIAATALLAFTSHAAAAQSATGTTKPAAKLAPKPGSYLGLSLTTRSASRGYVLTYFRFRQKWQAGQTLDDKCNLELVSTVAISAPSITSGVVGGGLS